MKISKQINKEVLITIALYLIYFVWWYYSCVVGLVLINVLVYVCIKLFFKDVDFEEYDNKDKKLDK